MKFPIKTGLSSIRVVTEMGDGCDLGQTRQPGSARGLVVRVLVGCGWMTTGLRCLSLLFPLPPRRRTKKIQIF